MSVEPATIVIPEDLLADMLVECQVWRGLVAFPAADWDELSGIMGAGTIEAGDAAAHIVETFLIDEDQIAAPLPAIIIRQAESELVERQGSFRLAGAVEMYVRLPLSGNTADLVNQAIIDARRKTFALRTELIQLAATAGRMRIINVASGPAMITDGTDLGYDEGYRYLETVVQVGYDGGGC